MEKAEFLRILAEGGTSAGSGTRTNWVDIRSKLQEKDEPFTKKDVAEEFGAPLKYVYQHLREWVQDGKLVVINHGGANVYMSALQAEE